MSAQFANFGFCYFAVDNLEDNEYNGFIGLSIQTYKARFTPCIAISWRLKRSAWNRGFATEGTKRCLKYAFDHLNIEKVLAIAPKANKKSAQFMTKMGMSKLFEFEHRLLSHDERLTTSVLYQT